MKKYVIIILIIVISSITSCYAQKNENNMAEKYDFELMRKIKEETGSLHAVLKKGDTAIYISSMAEDGAFINEYPPVPIMHFIQKKFYPNGYIKSKKNYIGKNLCIGESIYYDEQGNVKEIVNEDEKFGKIKLDWILNFAESEGLIDLKTGRGRNDLIITGNNKGYIKDGNFTLGFYKKGEFPVEDNNDYPLWIIQTTAIPENNFYEYIYKIHGETGKTLIKESKQIFRIE